MHEWIRVIGDYLALIAAIVGGVAAVNRWLVGRLVSTLEPKFDALGDRLNAVETQLKVDGGTSLRDAVNRIEEQQRTMSVVVRQTVNALAAAGLHAPVTFPTDEDMKDMKGRQS
jgi:hypothetical protein